MTRKTAFDRYLDKELKKPGIRAAYDEARAEIDAVDRLVRALDAARVEAGVSKADLARSISAKPEIVRRLFTSHGSNPTLATVAKLAAALGWRLELVPAKPKPALAVTARKPAGGAPVTTTLTKPKSALAVTARKRARAVETVDA